MSQKSNPIKQMRVASGLNQTEFWGRVHITQSGGSRYEGGRVVPKTVMTLLKIAFGTKKESSAAIAALQKGS